jgi:exoribonuclease II
VNQWQIIAVAKHGRTAALVAPFKPKDTALFAVISGFDAAYSAYNGYQSAIERYWTLKYLAQNDIQELDAAVMAGGLVRADTLPLVFRAIGADNLPRNARVRIKINGCDLLTLDVHASVLARIDEAAAVTSAEDAGDSGDDAGDDDDAVSSGPLTLAIDMSEGDAAVPNLTDAAAA